MYHRIHADIKGRNIDAKTLKAYSVRISCASRICVGWADDDGKPICPRTLPQISPEPYRPSNLAGQEPGWSNKQTGISLVTFMYFRK